MIKRALAVALCFAAVTASTRAQDTLYAATGSKGANGVLYTVNTTSGAFTAVAPILVGSSSIGLTGLAFNPTSGVLYGVTGLESPNFARTLVTIDPLTGAATVIGSLTGPFGSVGLSDIAFRADGTLFGFSPDDLFTVNLSTGALSTIGATGEGTPGGGLSFSPTGALFATAGLAASGTLDTLSTITGARTAGPALTNAPYAGSLGAINALAFNSAGVLYGSNSNRAQNGATVTAVELIIINTTTGAITDIDALPGNTDAIAFSVPEPRSTILLLSSALIGFVALVRRSRK